MRINFLIKIKVFLILLIPMLIITIAWEQITFSIKELIFFTPLLLLQLNKGTYEKIKNEIASINYQTFEILSFLLVLILNLMLVYKIYQNLQ